MRKSVLALRTNSYPNSATATRRFESFCRYLHEAGFSVTVLALAPMESEMQGRLHLNPECRFEVFHVRPIRRGNARRKAEAWLARYVFPRMEFNPTDNRVVSLAAHQLLRERKFHCILTTYPPMGSLALADQLSRRYGVPWIADLRDIPDEIDTGRVHWRTRRAVNALEAACASASHLVTVSEPLAERLRRDYRLARPVTTIYNGFEVDDIVHVEGKQPSDSIFRITYCGSFGYGRSLSLLQRSLRLLKIRGCSLDGVEIHIYGSRRSPSDWSDDICPDVPIKFHGRVPHETALRAESASAILLSLASPGAQGILTSKIFEYAMVGRPVLSIPADSGALDEFIRNAEIGLASSDPEEIATLIARHICEWRRTGALPVVVPNRDYLSAFSRRAQAARLVELVQVLLGRPQAP